MNITIDDLLNHVKTYNLKEVEIIKKAYEYAYCLHEGQIRQSGGAVYNSPVKCGLYII